MTNLQSATQATQGRPIDLINPILKEHRGENYIPLSETHNKWILSYASGDNEYEPIKVHRGIPHYNPIDAVAALLMSDWLLNA